MGISLLTSISVILLICNNAITQRFWLHYHTLSRLQSPLSLMDTQLLWPYESLEDYATWHELLPFCKWVNLTHQDMFIHGPFKFASVNGQKTWDCISLSEWDVLKADCNMFHNPLPCFDVPSYLIRVYCGAHVTFHSDAIAHQLIILAPNTNDTPGALHSPWQKVTASWANHANFLYTIMEVPLLRYDMLRWAIWMTTLPESQRSERVWHTMTNLWYFDCTFSPCQACDSACLVKYFWAA